MQLTVREDIHYTATHEWVRIEEKIAIVGITDHAQSLLGNLVFVELPKLGQQLKEEESCAVVESVKAASDVYTPIAGKVIEINDKLNVSPELVNEQPFDKGWLFKLQLNQSFSLHQLLTAYNYQAQIDNEA